MQKSTVEEIRARFDADVERFSSLETGQAAAVDSPLGMSLVTEAAAATTPRPLEVMDLGCGAGNYTLALLARLEAAPATIRLVDLSQPMLDRAESRIRATGFAGEILKVQGDLREIPFGRPDIVLAAAVLHHLRTPREWVDVFSRLYDAVRPGGGLWVYDMVAFENPIVGTIMRRRYGEYLTGLKGDAYRDQVFAYVEAEDTPAPLTYQLDLMRQVGFSSVDVLHSNAGFAAYGAVKR
ncbi:MAG: class I SAM-dependent methyltransferase [Fimbriimonas sp.]